MKHRNRDSVSAVDRAGRRVHDEARRKQYAFARKHWRWLSLAALTCLAPNLISIFVGTTFLKGVLLGVTATAAVCATASWVVLLTGTAPILMGANAERWTAEELESLKEHGYRVIHHAGLRRGDIDHVLIGPGGVLVFETKWRSGSWSHASDSQARRQVETDARLMRLTVRRFGIHTVTPVVVVWGPAAEGLPHPMPGVLLHPDTTVVLPGPAVRRWALSRSEGILTSEQIDALYQDLAALAGRRDEHEGVAPRSIAQIGQEVIRPVVAAYVALCTSFAVKWLPGVGDFVVVAIALIGGFVLRRRPGWRLAGTAFLTVETAFLLVVLLEVPELF